MKDNHYLNKNDCIHCASTNENIIVHAIRDEVDVLFKKDQPSRVKRLPQVRKQGRSGSRISLKEFVDAIHEAEPYAYKFGWGL